MNCQDLQLCVSASFICSKVSSTNSKEKATENKHLKDPVATGETIPIILGMVMDISISLENSYMMDIGKMKKCMGWESARPMKMVNFYNAMKESTKKTHSNDPAKLH